MISTRGLSVRAVSRKGGREEGGGGGQSPT